jgi:hypothetical protein
MMEFLGDQGSPSSLRANLEMGRNISDFGARCVPISPMMTSKSLRKNPISISECLPIGSPAVAGLGEGSLTPDAQVLGGTLGAHPLELAAKEACYIRKAVCHVV